MVAHGNRETIYLEIDFAVKEFSSHKIELLERVNEECSSNRLSWLAYFA